MFTWWAPWRNMKERNIGWRLDYVLASASIFAKVEGCVIQREFGTSDHGPVVATFAGFEVSRPHARPEPRRESARNARPVVLTRRSVDDPHARRGFAAGARSCARRVPGARHAAAGARERAPRARAARGDRGGNGAEGNLSRAVGADDASESVRRGVSRRCEAPPRSSRRPPNRSTALRCSSGSNGCADR